MDRINETAITRYLGATRANTYGLFIRFTDDTGTSVFTRDGIPSGTCILEYLGERISNAEANRRDKYYAKEGRGGRNYLCNVDRAGIVIDGEPTEPITFTQYWRFGALLNHAPDPLFNAVFNQYQRRVFIVTVRDVPAGSELMLFYGRQSRNVTGVLDFIKHGRPPLTNHKGTQVIVKRGSYEPASLFEDYTETRQNGLHVCFFPDCGVIYERTCHLEKHPVPNEFVRTFLINMGHLGRSRPEDLVNVCLVHGKVFRSASSLRNPYSCKKTCGANQIRKVRLGDPDGWPEEVRTVLAQVAPKNSNNQQQGLP